MIYSKCLILMIDTKTYNLYTFDNDRDREVFAIMNRRLLECPYDNVHETVIPIYYEMIDMILNRRYHNRIYL